jgi:hypothetical protein
MGYVTLVLPFSAGGDVAKRLLSTAWLFKVAVHKVLARDRYWLEEHV